MKKITPFLWFNNNLGDAIDFYTKIFKNTEVCHVQRGPDNSIFSASFNLEGQRFLAFNGGPLYTFSPSISFMIDCKDQEEVDELWEKLSSDGGEQMECGWVKDKFGLCWQIIPTILNTYLSDKDPEKSGRVMAAMQTMAKINIQGLIDAYEGKN